MMLQPRPLHYYNSKSGALQDPWCYMDQTIQGPKQQLSHIRHGQRQLSGSHQTPKRAGARHKGTEGQDRVPTALHQTGWITYIQRS
jgi:hypothetical protein